MSRYMSCSALLCVKRLENGIQRHMTQNSEDRDEGKILGQKEKSQIAYALIRRNIYASVFVPVCVRLSVHPTNCLSNVCLFINHMIHFRVSITKNAKKADHAAF